MIPRNSTPVPNEVFDSYLPLLKPTEVTLLLVVIRQTLGWYDPYTRKRKKRDWISGTQLREKTGYSRKAISTALESLSKHRLVRVFGAKGFELFSAEERRGKTRLWYAFNLPLRLPLSETRRVKSMQDMRKIYAQQKKLLLNKLSITENRGQPWRDVIG